MPKRKTAAENGKVDAAALEAEAEKLEKLASRKSAALEKLDEINARERDLLGPQDPPPEADPSKLDRILSELNQDGSFDVSLCVGTETKKIGQYPISDWPDRMERIANEKGGGTFKILFRDEAGRHCGQVLQTYDEESYSKGKPIAKPGDDSLGRVLEIMEKRDTESRAQIAVLQRENREILLKVIDSSANRGSTTKDVLDMAKFLHDAKSPQKSGLSEFRDFLSVLSDIRDDGAAEPPTPMESILAKALAVIKPLLDAGARKLATDAPVGSGIPQNPAAPAAPQIPGPNAVRPGPVVSSGEPPASVSQQPKVGSQPVPGSQPRVGSQPQDPRFLAYVQSLRQTIEAGMSPEVAAMVATTGMQTNPEAKKELLEFVQKSTVVDKVLEYAPDLSDYRDWFVIFFKAIEEELTLPEESQEPEPDVPEPEIVEGQEPEKKEEAVADAAS